MPNQTRVGFIGLGVMGGPMARFILQAGYPLTVFTRTRAKTEAIASLGANAAGSPAEVAKTSDIVISCLPDNETVREVLFTQPDCVAEGLAAGTVLVDTSTIAPSAAREFAERANEMNCTFLDAPLTGGQKGAEEGTLTIMVGGDPAALERVRPALEPTAQKIVYVGKSGMGQTMKMANQIAGMLAMVGVAESLVFCRKAGVDLELAIETIGSGASASWALANLGPKIVDRDFTPGFSVTLQQKDLRYALEAADELATPLPGTALCNQLYRALLAREEGHLSLPAVSLVIERLAGLDLPVKFSGQEPPA